MPSEQAISDPPTAAGGSRPESGASEFEATTTIRAGDTTPASEGTRAPDIEIGRPTAMRIDSNTAARARLKSNG